MIKLQDLLATNMRRFGTKNLNESDIATINEAAAFDPWGGLSTNGYKFKSEADWNKFQTVPQFTIAADPKKYPKIYVTDQYGKVVINPRRMDNAPGTATQQLAAMNGELGILAQSIMTIAASAGYTQITTITNPLSHFIKVANANKAALAKYGAYSEKGIVDIKALELGQIWDKRPHYSEETVKSMIMDHVGKIYLDRITAYAIAKPAKAAATVQKTPVAPVKKP